VTTKIEWCKNADGTQGSSWNPVTGCQPDFPCWERCYARRMANRLAGRYGYDKDDPFRPTFHPDKLDEPLRWRKPRTIFPVSMGDLFCDGVKDEWQKAIFGIISRATHLNGHVFVILTKRPAPAKAVIESLLERTEGCVTIQGGFFGNLVIGTSVSNQAEWDARVPVLCHIPAWRRVVSVEPMLGPIDVWEHLTGYCDATVSVFRDGKIVQLESPGRSALHDISKVNIHGILCGCETGPDARAMELDWARNLRDQCAEAGIAFFLKKTSPFKTIGGDVNRTLDGRTHDELCWTKETANE